MWLCFFSAYLSVTWTKECHCQLTAVVHPGNVEKTLRSALRVMSFSPQPLVSSMIWGKSFNLSGTQLPPL